jgi:outer membrane protein OmpA-like peptidoglycan-associated protein
VSAPTRRGVSGHWAVSGCLLLFAGSGCAAQPAPKQLTDARASYQAAQQGPGAKLSPVPLHDAKLALEVAEQSNVDDGPSERTVGLSYVADRKSRLASSKGNAAQAASEKAQATKGLAAFQAQELVDTKAGLQNARAGLQSARGELSMTKEQLAAEKVAREAADKRARDAMDKLGIAAALAIKEEPRGTVIVLPGAVLFASNKSELLPTARTKLDAVAEALKNQEDRKMVVEGHTDSQGTESSNMDLGHRRAQGVRDYLVSRGVNGDRISAAGIGQGRPVADNKSPEGRANNRRVEIVISTAEKR